MGYILFYIFIKKNKVNEYATTEREVWDNIVYNIVILMSSITNVENSCATSYFCEMCILNL